MMRAGFLLIFCKVMLRILRFVGDCKQLREVQCFPIASPLAVSYCQDAPSGFLKLPEYLEFGFRMQRTGAFGWPIEILSILTETY